MNALSGLLSNGESLRYVGLLADASVKAAAALVAVWATCLLLRRQSAGVRHLVWSLGVLSTVAVPVLSLALPQWQIPILPAWAPANTITSSSVAAADAPAPVPPAREDIGSPAPDRQTALAATPLEASGSQDASAQSANFPSELQAVAETAGGPRHWSAWVLVAWAAGAAAMLLPLLVGSVLMRRRASRATPVTDQQWLSSLQAAQRRLGIRRPVTLLQNRQSNVPVTWRFWRPVIMLPEEAIAWAQDRRQVVLLHELAHVKRADCLTQMLACLVQAVYWFNPMAWLAARAMRIERERACDDWVLASGLKPSDYASHLLEIVQTLRTSRCPSLAAVAMAQKSHFEGRLMAILDATRNRDAMTRVGILAVTVLVAGMAVPLACVKAAAPNEPASQPATDQAEIGTRARPHATLVKVGPPAAGATSSPAGGKTAQALLEAIRQAQRPTARMKVQWTYESVEPVAASPMGQPAPAQPPRPPHVKQKYTAYVSGIKSRIEGRVEMYASGNKDPYDVRDTLSIHDGNRQIRFTDLIKVPAPTPATPLGSQSPGDKNTSAICQDLWGNEIPIYDAAELSKWDITSAEGDSKGVYVLTALTPTSYYKGWRQPYRLTVDGTRGFNIVKIERMKPAGKYYEVNIALKRYPGGRWFPAERTRTDFHEDGSRIMQYKVSITDVTLNPEIPDDLFKFRFPKGTKVWDFTLEKWFTVGGNPDLPNAERSDVIPGSQTATRPS